LSRASGSAVGTRTISYSKVKYIRGKAFPSTFKILESAPGKLRQISGFTLTVKPSMAVICTGRPFSTGAWLFAFQYSPSTKTRPPFSSIGVSAFIVCPSIVSVPTFTWQTLGAKSLGETEDQRCRPHSYGRNEIDQRVTKERPQSVYRQDSVWRVPALAADPAKRNQYQNEHHLWPPHDLEYLLLSTTSR
jgi:hypothetical protein